MFTKFLEMAKSMVPRSSRLNSFELSESDTEQESTSNLKSVIFELQSFFPKEAAQFSEIDKQIEESKQENTEDDEEEFVAVPLYKLKFVARVRQDMRCVETLKNIRSIMEETSKKSGETNWDLMVKDGFKVECYHSFIYTLVKLIELNPSDKINRDLSFNAGRTYVCLLGLPGAKRCLIFEPELVMTYFNKLFTFDPQQKNSSSGSDYDEHFLEIQITQMLGECKSAFNIVCLSDQEDVLEKYIETLSNTLEHFMVSNQSSSPDIVMKCFENLEAFCLKPLPDKEIEAIMYLMFCRTVDLHFISAKRGNRRSSDSKFGDSISDFFLYLLGTYSDKTKNILMKFCKSLLSNLDHKYEKEKQQKLFDVAVKYELAVFWNSGESIISYLEKLALASEPRQRLNCVEFCAKMLLIDSTPDEQPTSRIELPRETFVIKILFEKVYDKQDNVKLKALTSLKNAIINGNEYCKKIFNAVFKNLTDDNPEIIGVLGEEAESFQNNLMSLLQTSPSTYIRKTCLEILAQNCDNLLDNEIFIDTISSLTDDGSYLVKIQLLEIVNSLLTNHSTNKNVLDLWLDVVLNLIRDNDNKIVDASIKSLTAIFQKIESFENTVSDMQLLPWNIIRLIMAKGKRNMLQSAMSTVTTNFLSQDKLRKIETHIFTSNKSEAWCLLSIIAKRMKSNNPDIVVKTFLDHIDHFEDPSFDTTDFHLVLETIQNWTTTFNDGSKTQIATKLSHALENGKCSISTVHHLYEICEATRTILYGNDETVKFTQRLNEISKKYILGNAKEFASNASNERMLCFMLVYCESNIDLPERPDRKVIDFTFDFLRKVLNDKLKISLENDIPRKLNCCIITLTRFALRDAELASELTPDLAMLLKKRNMHIAVTKTSMQCLNDLCKKHTSTVAPVFKEIIYKLHSQNEEVRLCALANIYDLVMQDFIKMKGRVLLNFLACLVDKNEVIQLKSQAAILSYTNDKNQNLLYTCFLESVFLFNDYIQTDNFSVFPPDEIDRNYRLLHGAENREARYELYSFFVQNIHDLNEVHLLMLLKQIIVIKEKLEKKAFLKHPNGVELFKDLLHIFKLICDKRGESKMSVNKADNADYADNDDVDADEVAQTSTASQPKAGRKNNKSLVTVNDALPVLDKMILIYPTFAKLVTEYDASLEEGVKLLTSSIASNFPKELASVERDEKKSYDSLTSYEQLVRKGSAALGSNFKRRMLFFVMSNSTDRMLLRNLG